jgi:predicted nucleic acid-binding protein
MDCHFDTDAISELSRPRPASTYVKWIMKVAREEQFTSAVVIGELYKGAHRSQDRELLRAACIPWLALLIFVFH